MSWNIDREEFDEAVKEQDWEWIWSVIAWAQTRGPECWRCGALPEPEPLHRHRYQNTEYCVDCRAVCDHQWGTDGAHSNEYCKHCFKDKK